MKKHSLLKSLMKFFALLASIGGILYLFKDKLFNCSLFASDGILHKVKENFTTDSDMDISREDSSEEDDDYNFEHAFDVDPAAQREYVSLNITGNSDSFDEETAEEIV